MKITLSYLLLLILIIYDRLKYFEERSLKISTKDDNNIKPRDLLTTYPSLWLTLSAFRNWEATLTLKNKYDACSSKMVYLESGRHLYLTVLELNRNLMLPGKM